MGKYFISKGNEKKGPFTIEEIQIMELTDEYSIWTEGFKDWKSVTEIELLKGNIIITPPPPPKKLKKAKAWKSIKFALGISSIVLIVMWVVIFFLLGGMDASSLVGSLFLSIFISIINFIFIYAMNQKIEIALYKTNLGQVLKRILISFLISFGILFSIALFGEFEDCCYDEIVCLNTPLTSDCYQGSVKTFSNYNEKLWIPEYYRSSNYNQASNKITDIYVYKFSNFYLPLVLFEKIALFLFLTIILFLFSLGLKIIMNRYFSKGNS